MYAARESSLTPALGVEEHVRAAARVLRREGSVEEVVERFRLGAVRDRLPRARSGGERQRVRLALAVVRRPDCLLFDEPFAGVAPADTAMVVDGPRELARAGCAVVLAGHRVNALPGLADEVIWVTSGTTHWLGTPTEARAHEQFRKEYLGRRWAGR